ncbi:flagellar biosynthesis protein FlhF [Clostridium tyrobutyricum]|uniref:flagellar biosynthesis protein FlhF n=1 Tax=Clostridium tyrobutyricum TaxID=1519 RepID=UPI001C38F32D|nr:flagellar biosynthesis protein FlhF [Clostridium tyrobutyricum]MBV4426928.1 flagellar biosynthesis protein FlhF [Clostridium tyrobutyricum]MBV4442084.1 flagellar biosynthesis protein FlhF [Clostridium tyrobutyricum]
MIVRKYKARNMHEAILKIRRELGKNAVIISQRKIRKSGLLGLFSQKIFEVTVTADNSDTRDINDYDTTESIEAFKKAVKHKTHDLERINNEDIIKEVKDMRNMLNNVMQNSIGIGKSKLQLKLENSDLNTSVINNIMREMSTITGDLEDREKLRLVVQNMIRVDHRKLDKTVVLVGPTGVGKTTTIAKLAGKMALVENKKVGLITIDTYRIGAVEQLRTYADIINIPFKVVLNVKDMEKAIESMEDCDVILVDTTGRSSKNKMQISELRTFIDKLNTDNIHLVISCTTKNSDIDVIVNGYKQLNYNNVIITKLDETCTYGSILNIENSSSKPISFVTTGQNVPEDIKCMDSDELTKLVLGEDIIC